MQGAGCFGFGRWVLPAFIVGLALQPAVGLAQTASPRADRPVTFTKDVAPIMNRSCVRCHRPDEIAPMSLLTYSDARPWARAIKERREQARDAALVPRQDDRHPEVQGRSVVDRRRDRDDRQVGGLRRTARAIRPTCRRCRRQTIPARGRSVSLISSCSIRPSRCRPPGPNLYGTLTAPFNTTEDRYIKAIQSRVVDANSRKVIHHALSFAVDPSEDGDMGDDSGGGSGQFLVEYASGKNATFYTDDTGQLLPGRQVSQGELSLPLDR